MSARQNVDPCALITGQRFVFLFHMDLTSLIALSCTQPPTLYLCGDLEACLRVAGLHFFPPLQLYSHYHWVASDVERQTLTSHHCVSNKSSSKALCRLVSIPHLPYLLLRLHA